MSSSSMSAGTVLNSWKEIASHLRRGVRTVQRWEQDLGMPVRRPRGKSRSAVIAMADEIDAWLRNAPAGDLSPRKPTSTETLSELHQAIAEHLVLRDRCNRLRAANEQAISNLMASLKQIHESIADSRRHRISNPMTDLVRQTTKLQAEANNRIRGG